MSLNISIWQPMRLVISQTGSSSFDNLSGLNAAGTDFHPAVAATRKLNPDRLEVRIKTPSRFIVSV
jgi:hypothetical protein